ncbi:DUF6879 family protein [Pseudonocardia spinosispora]|uniref:DUF6879 family protein n=1 Tax=Pseudonocardia spinosispora TaxID=103441 RepID=UPI00041090AC|nr:DUF6879 family protein [Pseudonocardia spinosispora]
MKRIDVDELYSLYNGVRDRAVRWEGLQVYRVPWEKERIEAWERGETAPADDRKDRSTRSMRRISESGRRSIRVRGLRRPATDYIRRQFATAYPNNAAAGEDTVVVDLDEHPEFDGVEDFVVFDRKSVMWYRYDDECRLLGYDFSDDAADVADRVALLDRMLVAAVPYTEVVL